MTWWHWVTASIEAALLTILVLLWHDTLRERRGWRLAQHRRFGAATFAIIPIGFVIVALCPLWLALVLLAVPALAILVMALAS